MIRYIIRRLLWAILLFIAVTLVTFVIFYVIPLSPAKNIAGKAATPAEVKAVAHRLHLDQPLYRQYLYYLEQLVIHHNLGYSYANRQSVNSIVRAAIPITAVLVIGGAILWLFVAFVVGVYSAIRPGSKLDRFLMIGVLIGISVHPVWLGLITIYGLGYIPTTGHIGPLSFPSFELFPLSGYCNFSGGSAGQVCGGPLDWFQAMLLPWGVFAFGYTAFYVRVIRATVRSTMAEDYVRTARAKGAPERTVMRSHVLRNAVLPIITMFGMDLSLALGGAVIVELVFGLPGLGYVGLHSLFQFDYPVTLGVLVFSTLVIIVVNFFIDLLYAWVDPRIRLT
jgi:peptide/nickel transport system permease protein